MAQEEHSATTLEETADAQLIEYSRAGDSQAFGELWRRHYNAGRTVARSFTSSLDPDDLVQESFARIYQSIQNGGGPNVAFRAYLFTTIRNTAAAWGRAKQETSIDTLESFEDPTTNEDATVEALDRSLTTTAFRSLPTRWQEVLWYSEIERMTPQEIGPLLGMKANSVAALAYRAREGLRQAWVQAHLQAAPDGSDHRWTIERLGAYARGSLGERDTAKLERHLDECARCTIVAAEAKDVSSRMALVLLPLTAGVAGAVGYLAWIQQGGSTVGAAIAMPAAVTGGVVAASATGAAVGSTAGSSMVGSTVGTGAGTVAGGTGAAAGGAASTTVGFIAAGVLAVSVAAAAIVFVPSFFTPNSPVSAPTSESSAPSDPAAPEGEPITQPAPSEPPVAVEPEPTPPPADPAPVVPPVTRPTPPVVPVVPEPVDPDPVDPQPQVPEAPAITAVVQASPLVHPRLSGTAVPGATVEILDLSNTDQADAPVVATVTADENGRWQSDQLPLAFTSDGESQSYVLSARQTTDGGMSAPSTVTEPIVLSAPPSFGPIDSPVRSDEFDFVVTGTPMARIQVRFSGDDWSTFVLPVSGRLELMANDASSNTLEIRYLVDDEHGPTRSFTLVFEGQTRPPLDIEGEDWEGTESIAPPVQATFSERSHTP